MASSPLPMTVLLTGASSGIGRMTALALARAGTRLILVSRRAPLLHEVTREVTSSGGTAVAFPGDVTVADTMIQAVASALHHYGRLDVLINNAGEGLFATTEQTTEEDLDRMLAVNFKGAFHAIKAALPVMRSQGTGHIVNVASTAGRRGSPYVGAYCASKFALVGFTESLRTELLGTGIRVSLICPGATTTAFFRAAQRRTVRHQGLVGPVETPQRVAERVLLVLRRPRAEVIAQPVRRRLFLTLNLFAPGFVDRLIAILISSSRGDEHDPDAST